MATIKYQIGNTVYSCLNVGDITGRYIAIQAPVGSGWGSPIIIPLFSGNSGSVVEHGDYKYTLGHLCVDGLRPAISRELANSTPEIQLVEARRLAGDLCQIVVKVRDLNNDDLYMYIDKMVNDVTPGASQQFKYEKIQESTKTITDTRDWQEVRFTVQLNYVGGYSGMEYVWRLSVSDGKSTKVMDGNIKK